MDKILADIAASTLKQMKQSQQFPHSSGALKHSSDATVVGDDIIISFGSSYSGALARSSKHRHFGSKLAAEQQTMIGKSLKDQSIKLLESHLILLEGEFK